MHKTRPHAAVRTAPRFVINERERRLKAREITREQALDQQKAEEEANKKDAEVANAKINGVTHGEGVDDMSPPSTVALASPHDPEGDLP